MPALLIAASLLMALGGCAGKPRAAHEQEDFSSIETFSRSFPGTREQVCEAARRALLSQGYVLDAAAGDRVNGSKSFQPDGETHVQIEFHIVCAPQAAGSRASLAFVNAVEDRYALKKSSNSASVGVGVLGSVSLPFSAGNDSMVKIASATITSAPYYDKFFALVTRFLPGGDDEGAPEPAPPEGPPSAASAPSPPVPMPPASAVPVASGASTPQ